MKTPITHIRPFFFGAEESQQNGGGGEAKFPRSGVMATKCLFSSVAFSLFLSHSYAMTSFELHNINEAHKQGFTGKGVTIGIVDSVFNPQHPLFGKDKFISVNDNTTTQQNRNHGNHVAGIAAGSYTDGANYGIAKDSGIVSYGNLGVSSSSDSFKKILEHNVKIVNNSHTANLKDLQKFSKDNDVLIIYAAGNDSLLKPTMAALHGTGSKGNVANNEYNLGAWLVVGNIDSSYVTRDTTGKQSLDERAIGGKSASTHLCVDASSYCLMAAGTNILSAGEKPNDKIEDGAPPGFYHATGTSMAAPAVTGTAALVAEKFPFLGGKQLADVLLSTADSDFTTPDIIYKHEDKNGVDNVIFLDGAEIPLKKDGTTNNDGTKYDYDTIKKKVEDLFPGSNLGLQANNITVLEKTKEEVYGQGIMDAQKALKGLAEIDINRISKDDLENSTGFYPLNTKGYDALFENDIDQKDYDKKYFTDPSGADSTALQNITQAGLKKQGAGTLGLTGNLNYKGETRIEEGTIALLGGTNQNVAGNISVKNGASLYVGTQVSAPNSEVKNEGTMTVGTDANPQHLKAKTLTNQGTLNLGDNPHGEERVQLQDKFTQGENATLNAGYLSVQNGKATNRAIKATDYDVKGTVNYKPLTHSGTRQTIPLSLNGMENKLTNANVKVTTSGHAVSYTLSSGNTNLIATPVANIYADFDGSNMTLAKVLVPMSDAAQTLSADYDTFFRAVNAADYNLYKEALLAIDDVSHLENNELLLAIQSQEILEKVANLQGGVEGAFLRPRFSHLKTDGISARRIGFDIFANKFTPWGFGSAFINYDNLSGDLSSQMVSLGAGLKNNLSWLGVFGGARLGYVKNSVKRDGQDPVKYNTLSGNLFAGVDVDLAMASLPQTRFLPTFYIDYQYFRQQGINHPGVNYRNSRVFESIVNSGYKYSGGNLFARHIAAKNLNTVSANIGLNVQQTLVAPWSLGAHLFYERRLNGKDFKTSAQFNDFAGTFEQTYQLNQNFVRFGMDVNYETPLDARGIVYYATIGIDYEMAAGGNNKYRAYGADFKGGIKF